MKLPFPISHYTLNNAELINNGYCCSPNAGISRHDFNLLFSMNLTYLSYLWIAGYISTIESPTGIPLHDILSLDCEMVMLVLIYYVSIISCLIFFN